MSYMYHLHKDFCKYTYRYTCARTHTPNTHTRANKHTKCSIIRLTYIHKYKYKHMIHTFTYACTLIRIHTSIPVHVYITKNTQYVVYLSWYTFPTRRNNNNEKKKTLLLCMI